MSDTARPSSDPAPPRRRAPRAGASTAAGQTPAGRAAAIATAIRQAVVEHRLPPGTKLPEDQIGALFGASRTLVRAALQALSHDRIVVLAKNRGASVASPTVEEARDLFDARRVTEAALVRRAAERMRPSDGLALKRLIERGRRASQADDRGTAIRLSGEFHLAVAAIARQPVLQSFLEELISRTSLVIALYGRSQVTDCGEAEHRALLAALLAKDAAGAAALMLDHLKHIEHDLVLSEIDRPATSIAEALGGHLASV